MTDPVTIRVADVGDRDPLLPLARDFATSFTVDRDRFDSSFEILLEQPSALLLVAHEQLNLVGYLLAFVHPTFLANGPVAWVEEVMVAEEARRRGVGRALVRRAEQWGAEAGAAYVALASRRAGSFYRALGYEESATFYKKNVPPLSRNG